MNHNSDDETLRRLVQRVKRTDPARTPSFESVLNGNSLSRPSRPVLRSPRLLIALSAVVLVAITWFAFPSNRPPEAPDIQTAERDRIGSPSGTRDLLAEIDFDALETLIDQHFRNVAAAQEETLMPVWSSRTDSLLSLSLDPDQEEESVPWWILQLDEPTRSSVFTTLTGV